MMLTLLIAVLLAFSHYQKYRDRTAMTGTDHVLYYAVAVTSLALAIADDLGLSVTMPTEWIKPWLDRFLQA